MKRFSLAFRSLAAVGLLFFVSCSSDTSSLTDGSGKVAQVLDLNDFTYQQADSLIRSGAAVLLKDSDKVVPVSAFVKATDAEITMDGKQVSAYNAVGNDSVSIEVSPDFVSIRIGDQGDKLAYLAYSAPSGVSEVAKAYAARNISINGASPLLRSTGGSSMKINLSAIQREYADTSAALTQNDALAVSAEQKAAVAKKYNLSTRAASTYEFPRNRKVTINLLYANYSYPTPPLPHELTWQVDDARRSIADVFRSNTAKAPILIFNIRKCDFKSTQKAYNDLEDFWCYVYDRPSEYPTAGKDIFFFVRWGEWGWQGMGAQPALGVSYVDTYHINDLENTVCFGISCTTCAYPYVLAHELGHIFAADHTTTPWYRLNRDLMNATKYAWTTPYHRTDVKQGSYNRNVITSCLQQK